MGPAPPGPGPVLGAERDGFFTLAELRRTAAADGVEAEVFSGMGHNLMLDQGWPQVADRIDTWVRGLPPASPQLLGRRTQ